MEVLYAAEATSSGGHEGRVGGLGKPGTTNPEELFAAGYATCLENAMLRATRGNIDVSVSVV